MASLLLLVGLVVGASFTGVVVVCSLVMWVREHSCYCSMPCPCKDPSDHKICGLHKERWFRCCPYQMIMFCQCRSEDECKLSLSEAIFRENRENVREELKMRITLIIRWTRQLMEIPILLHRMTKIQVTDQVQDTMEYARRQDNRNIQELKVFFT